MTTYLKQDAWIYDKILQVLSQKLLINNQTKNCERLLKNKYLIQYEIFFFIKNRSFLVKAL